MRAVALALSACLLPSVPSVAEAGCGLFGFGSTMAEAGPVDLSALRILLVVDDPGAGGATKITGVYQVGFEGSFVGMGFLLPVPSLPDEVRVYDPALFADLDALTAPVLSYSLPTGGCGMNCSSGGADDLRVVEVYATGTVGPYEYTVLQGADGGPVVDWLVSNGFDPPPGLEPLVQSYVDAGYYFLAVRMTPDLADRTLPPIAVSYYAAAPTLPLRLAAMGDVGEMGVLVYVIGPVRFRPGNFAEIAIDPATLWVNELGETNYLDRVSEEADAAGGRAFVTELATSLEDWTFPADGSGAVGADAAELLARGSFLTRLYTRISPEELTLDAAFDRGDLTPVTNWMDVAYAAGMRADAGLLAFAAAALVAGAASAVRARRARPRPGRAPGPPESA